MILALASGARAVQRRPGSHRAAGLVVLLMISASLLVSACNSTPPPDNTSDDWLKRREMANTVVSIAEEAGRNDDLEKQAAAWQLLIDLWADMPEARMGGAWRDEAAETDRLLGYRDELEVTRKLGENLTRKLEQSGDQLETLKTELEPIVLPGLTYAWVLAAQRGARTAFAGAPVGLLSLETLRKGRPLQLGPGMETDRPGESGLSGDAAETGTADKPVQQ